MIFTYDKISNHSKKFYDSIYSKLNNNEKLKIDNKNTYNKNASLLGIFLLNKLLNKFNISYYNEKISHNKNGKPYIKKYKDIHFNISHDNDCVVCVINNTEIGIDIIWNGRKSIKLNAFSNNIEFNNFNHTLLELFSIKESYIKMNGDNILDIKNFDINKIIYNKKAHFLKCTQISDYLVTISIKC